MTGAHDPLDDLTEPVDPADRPGLVGALVRYRTVLLVAGVLWFGLVIGGGIVLSSVDARYGLHVFGTGTWVAGEPAVVRAALRDLQFSRYQPLGPLTVTLTDAEGVEAPPQRVTDPAGAFVQGAVTAPGRPGTWQVRIDTIGPDGPVTARFPITVVAEPPRAAWPTPPKPKTPPRPDRGPLKLDFAPLDRVLPGNLPGTLVVRASAADGQPLSTEVGLTWVAGRSANPLPSKVVTDRHGLATFDVMPMEPLFEVQLMAFEAQPAPDGGPAPAPPSVDPPPSDAPPVAPNPVQPGRTLVDRRVHHTNTQFAMAVPGPLVEPGDPIEVQVRALHQDADVFVDAWHGDRWLAASTTRLKAGAGRAFVRIPPLPADPAVVWVQVFKNAYLPGDARAGRALVVSRKPIAEVTAWVIEHLSKTNYPGVAALAAGVDDSPRLLRDLLGRMPRPDGEPPLLADSGITAKQTVAEIKSVWETRLVMALVGSGLILFIVMGVLIIGNQRQVQRGWAEAGGADEGDVGTRKRLLLDAGYMFLVLALFLIGMIQLLLTVRW